MRIPHYSQERPEEPAAHKAYRMLMQLRDLIGHIKHQIPQDEFRLLLSPLTQSTMEMALQEVDGVHCPCGRCNYIVNTVLDFRPHYDESGSLVRFCTCPVLVFPEIEDEFSELVSEAIEVNSEFVKGVAQQRKREDEAYQRGRNSHLN